MATLCWTAGSLFSNRMVKGVSAGASSVFWSNAAGVLALTVSVDAPAGALGCGGGVARARASASAFACSFQVWNSFGGTARTVNVIDACASPQNSAH